MWFYNDNLNSNIKGDSQFFLGDALLIYPVMSENQHQTNK